MDNILIDFVDKYISEVSPNVYEINCRDFYELISVNNALRKMVIKAKQEFVESGKKLSDSDLFLVRTMSELPDNLVYQSFSNRGAFTKMKNPFERIMEDRGLSDEQINEKKLVCPIYRDTVHFSINGIVSNLWYTDRFTNRGITVMEPIANHFDRLVNINPVDSFIDVGMTDEPIKNNAVFIIDKNIYLGLSQEMKNKIASGKLYLFDSKKYESDEVNEDYPSPLEIVSDMVICHNGSLPQHTVSQFLLRNETCNYEGNHYSDKEYLKMFTDLIDKISTEVFNVSYYTLNDKIKAKREVDKDNYGVFHSDTKYYEEEQSKNYNYRLDTIRKYLSFLHEELGLSKETMEYIYDCYCRYVDLNYSRESYGGRGMWRLSLVNYDDANDFINKVSFDKFIEVTDEFNRNQMELLNKNASQRQISEMFNNNEVEDLHRKYK